MRQASEPARVVIVGGGFAGLACARALDGSWVSVTLVDRRNHHLFQPLLYQVATAALSPAHIAAPIRSVLRKQRNCRVLMDEVNGFDLAARTVVTRSGLMAFDVLVLAAGVTHSYFGNDAWEPNAPGLKTIEDAVEIRRRLLTSFEVAERTSDEPERKALLTFVVVGAGPTGVELAGAIVEIALSTMPREFTNIRRDSARVVLVEAQPRLLSGGFPETLSDRALSDLLKMGVEVRLNTRVTAIDALGVTVQTPEGRTERIDSRNAIWAAGVKASPLGSLIATAAGLEPDRAGRVHVDGSLALPGHPHVFVIGDLATVKTDTGLTVPGVAPAAMQMGRFVGRLIAKEILGTPAAGPDTPRATFQYRDKGMLATIGRARAVASIGGRNFGGPLAWVLWAVVHIAFLIDFRSKLFVLLEWIWAYLTFRGGARLITEKQR